MSKKKVTTKKITNRRASFDYQLGDDLVAGISLNGRETKALRLGHGHLRGAYVIIRADELWLVNATITGFNGVTLTETEQVQDRKLLVKKRELNSLIEAKKQGKSLVPMELLTGGRYIKLRLAVGTGKKRYDKRQVLKARDDKRSTDAALKSRQRLS